MVELMIVLGIIVVIIAAAIPTIATMLRESRVRQAYEDVLSAMRRAHEAAIDRRRVVVLTFTKAVGSTPANIQFLEEVKGVGAGGGTIYSTAPAVSTPNPETINLPQDMDFILPNPVPGVSPDGLPTAPAVPSQGIDYGYNSTSAGAQNKIYFQANGQVLENNENGPVADGVIYVGRAKDPTSNRAVSILGQTGRVKGWRLKAGVWTEY